MILHFAENYAGVLADDVDRAFGMEINEIAIFREFSIIERVSFKT